MSLPVKTGFPDGITVKDSYVVRFTATHPTTGALVAGVKVSNVSIFGDDSSGNVSDFTGPLMYVAGDGTPV